MVLTYLFLKNTCNILWHKSRVSFLELNGVGYSEFD